MAKLCLVLFTGLISTRAWAADNELPYPWVYRRPSAEDEITEQRARLLKRLIEKGAFKAHGLQPITVIVAGDVRITRLPVNSFKSSDEVRRRRREIGERLGIPPEQVELQEGTMPEHMYNLLFRSHLLRHGAVYAVSEPDEQRVEPGHEMRQRTIRYYDGLGKLIAIDKFRMGTHEGEEQVFSTQLWEVVRSDRTEGFRNLHHSLRHVETGNELNTVATQTLQDGKMRPAKVSRRYVDLGVPPKLLELRDAIFDEDDSAGKREGHDELLGLIDFLNRQEKTRSELREKIGHEDLQWLMSRFFGRKKGRKPLGKTPSR